MLRIVDVQRVVVERGEGTHYATHDCHRVAVTTETIEEGFQLVVNHGVVLDGAVELLLLFCGGQFALEQQITGFKEIRLFRQLLNRVAPMQENAFVAINEGDLGFAGRGRHETGVECEDAFSCQAANIYDVWTQSARIDRQIDGGSALDDQLRFFVSH